MLLTLYLTPSCFTDSGMVVSQKNFGEFQFKTFLFKVAKKTRAGYNINL